MTQRSNFHWAKGALLDGDGMLFMLVMVMVMLRKEFPRSQYTCVTQNHVLSPLVINFRSCPETVAILQRNVN